MADLLQNKIPQMGPKGQIRPGQLNNGGGGLGVTTVYKGPEN